MWLLPVPGSSGRLLVLGRIVQDLQELPGAGLARY
jgi:hypothetical protein